MRFTKLHIADRYSAPKRIMDGALQQCCMLRVVRFLLWLPRSTHERTAVALQVSKAARLKNGQVFSKTGSGGKL